MAESVGQEILRRVRELGDAVERIEKELDSLDEKLKGIAEKVGDDTAAW